MLAGDAAPILLTREGAVGDAQQGVVRLRLRRLGVIDVVGGDQRHVVGVGPVDQATLGDRLLRQTVALQLYVESVAEDALHLFERRYGFIALVLDEQRVDRAVGTAGQQDQPLGLIHNQSPGHARLRHLAGVEIGGGRQGAEVEPALLVLDQQDHGRGLGPTLGDLAADAQHRQGAGDDGLDARVLGGLAEFQGAEQVGAVGHGHGGHAGVRRHLADLAGLDRPFQQGIGAADPQMDKTLTVRRFRQYQLR
ncbi:hypothetical protein D3C72_765340 [compost metagenome]